MNYGESIAYWYLRLHGFFPIHNFVLHAGADLRHNADIDVLALRLPHSYEPIGGKPEDWDPWFINQGLALGEDRIGVIVEVKTSERVDRDEVDRAFHIDRLAYAIRRLGLFRIEEAQELAKSLSGQASVRSEDSRSVVAKILIANQFPKEDDGYFRLPLSSAVEFIRVHIRHYEQKFGARMFFPSDVLQGIIMEEHEARLHQGNREKYRAALARVPNREPDDHDRL